MSSAHKYAELLDIDPEAPDVFETPELTDDTSTLPTSGSPPPESSTDEIDRHGIDPDQARNLFLPAADGAAVSGTRIAYKQRGYHSSSRWRKKDGLEVNGDELDSEEEDEEGLERKLARLRREIAEVKSEFERQKSEIDGEKNGVKGDDVQKGKKGVTEGDLQEIEALNEVLSSVASTASAEGPSATTRFTKRLALASSAAPKPTPSTEEQQPPSTTEPSTTYTLTYAPTYNHTHTLSQITSFDTRLSSLESLLGIDTLPTSTQVSVTPTPKPLLPTLDIVSQQLTTLATAISSPSTLDALTRRVRLLATETQSLEGARKAASAAPDPHPEDASDGASTPTESLPKDPLNHPDTLTKLNALHALLPTITSLAPLLSPTLDRLRSLRTLHAEAATASQTLRQVEERQEAIGEEVKAWRAGLEQVEKKMEEAGGRWEGNAKVVEGWVRELEGRVESLGGTRGG